MRILLIIPAYNEEKNILSVYRSIVKYNEEHQTNYDVIVINDCSKDSTSEILNMNNIPHIDLIHNLGIGGAVQTGYKYALAHGYDIAVQYDGDGQHDINYVKNIIFPICDGKADFVIGSRFIDDKTSSFKSSIFRRAGITLISVLIKLVTGKTVKDTTSGFRAVNKTIIQLFSESYPVEYPEPITTTELLRKNFILEEVPVAMHERTGGKSSITPFKSFYYMINVILNILVVRFRRYPHAR